jgi:hypothetical protein
MSSLVSSLTNSVQGAATAASASAASASASGSMTSAKPLILNPADVKVDDSLPAYPENNQLTNIVNYSTGVKRATSEEITAALPLRKAARAKVDANLKTLLDKERTDKNAAKDAWAKATPEVQAAYQNTLDTYKLNEYTTLVTFVKTELVWWNNNKELSTVQVNTRDMAYDEQYATYMDKYTKAKDAITQSLAKSKQDADDEKRAAAAKALSATTVDIAVEVSHDAYYYIKRIFYILLCLRFASFLANDYIHKTVPFRVLAFIYGFIFAPFIAPYYIWKELSAWIFKTRGPLFISFLPIVPYNMRKYNDLVFKLFGYVKDEVAGIVSSMKAAELAQKVAAIQRKIIPELDEERAVLGA